MSGETAINYRPVHVRHIVLATATTPGAVQVLGQWFVPADRAGVNGPGGFIAGEIEDRLGEEGAGKIAFPNTVGGDGVRHLDRFACLAPDRKYEPGDEWLEVYEGPGPVGDLIGVFTPAGDRTITRSRIEILVRDGLYLQKKQRETAAGIWNHAPRDVIEHYSGAWQVLLADEFEHGFARNAWSRSRATVVDNAIKLTLPEGAGVSTSAYLLATAAQAFIDPTPTSASFAPWRLEVSLTIPTLPASVALGVGLTNADMSMQFARTDRSPPSRARALR